MIAVAVGDEKMRKRRKIRTVTKTVTIRIGGEIEEKSVVQYRLRTGADVASAAFFCGAAGIAMTKQRRNSLGGGSAPIL